MKIDLQSVNTESFMVHPHIINGEVCQLIQPQHINCKWTKDNIIFRSSVWNSDGELISAGFPKFPNFLEKPDVFPVPTNLKNASITNKLDGSLLVVSRYKGQYILRTRGTVDATKLENGYELEVFKNTILPSVGNPAADTWDYSFLFEWLTASADHKIVLKYENVPDWILIGAINHNDYSLYTQRQLNEYADLMTLKRPEQFSFNTVDELVDAVTNWKDKEGVVLYTNGDQSLHKIKSDDYKKKHAFKSNATLENTLELYFTLGRPTFGEFQAKVIELYDWECAQMVIGHISNISDAAKEVNNIVNGFKTFVNNTLKALPTRKDQAQKTIASYAVTNRSQMIFSLLDGKELTNEQMTKLFWQVLKK